MTHSDWWDILPLVLVIAAIVLAACSDIGPEHVEANRRLEQCRLLHGAEWCSRQDAGGQANYHKPEFGK